MKEHEDKLNLEDGPFITKDVIAAHNWCKIYGMRGVTSEFACDTTWIIGGESVYQQTLDMGIVSEVLATEVKKTYEGDTFFPKLEGEWESEIEKDNEDFQVVRYKKVE